MIWFEDDKEIQIARLRIKIPARRRAEQPERPRVMRTAECFDLIAFSQHLVEHGCKYNHPYLVLNEPANEIDRSHNQPQAQNQDTLTLNS